VSSPQLPSSSERARSDGWTLPRPHRQRPDAAEPQRTHHDSAPRFSRQRARTRRRAAAGALPVQARAARQAARETAAERHGADEHRPPPPGRAASAFPWAETAVVSRSARRPERHLPDGRSLAPGGGARRVRARAGVAADRPAARGAPQPLRQRGGQSGGAGHARGSLPARAGQPGACPSRNSRGRMPAPGDRAPATALRSRQRCAAPDDAAVRGTGAPRAAAQHAPHPVRRLVDRRAFSRARRALRRLRAG
jgi:hypothetical protein